MSQHVLLRGLAHWDPLCPTCVEPTRRGRDPTWRMQMAERPRWAVEMFAVEMRNKRFGDEREEDRV